MGSIGTRPQINKQTHEPPLLGGNVNDVIKSIADLGFINAKGRVDIVAYVKSMMSILFLMKSCLRLNRVILQKKEINGLLG